MIDFFAAMLLRASGFLREVTLFLAAGEAFLELDFFAAGLFLAGAFFAGAFFLAVAIIFILIFNITHQTTISHTHHQAVRYFLQLTAASS